MCETVEDMDEKSEPEDTKNVFFIATKIGVSNEQIFAKKAISNLSETFVAKTKKNGRFLKIS